jgi:CNT family concentrative nucleoside transporter
MVLAVQSLIGVVAIPALVWALSEDRRALSAAGWLKWIAAGLGVQIAIAIVLTQLPWTQALFALLGRGVDGLQAAVDAGARLMFGYLAGGPAPFESTAPENAYLVAFRVLPMILVLGALIRLFYYWGVLQAVVGALARLFRSTLGLGGPLATVAGASPFLGLVEAPMLIRPYLATMSRGALFAMLVLTMATVAGTVMALYASVLAAKVPGAAGHLLAGSLMNVPAALMLARLAVPAGFSEGPETSTLTLDNPPGSSMDAIVQGTLEGVGVVASIAAMLIVVVALVTLSNMILGVAGDSVGVTLTLQRLLGWLFAPVAFAIGIPWSEAATAGSILGLKVVLNEFLAYLELVKVPQADLSDRSRLIMTYALCGFANLGSLGISIGALATMAPERRADLVEITPRAVAVGFLATLLSGAVIGALTW